MILNNTSNTSSDQNDLLTQKKLPEPIPKTNTENGSELAIIISEGEKQREEDLKKAGDLSNSIKSGNYFNSILNEANRQKSIEDKYNQAINNGNNTELDSLLNETKKEYQGGLSDEIFSSKHMKEYMLNCKGVLYNYFQLDGFRSNELDKYLESSLRKKGLNTEEISNFLCSMLPKIYLGEYDDNSISIENRKDILDSVLDNIVNDIKKSIENENLKISIAKSWIENNFGVKVIEINLKNTSRGVGGGQDGNFYNFNGEVIVRTKTGETKTLQFIDGLGKPTMIIDWNGKAYKQEIRIKK